MKNLPTFIIAALVGFNNFPMTAQKTEVNLQAKNETVTTDKIQALKDTLLAMEIRSDNFLYTKHCQSVLAVIEAKGALTVADNNFLEAMYDAFCNVLDDASSRDFNSYYKRQRLMVVSWVSPTDGATSFAMLQLPNGWDPSNSYPLYIQLHGLWNVAASPIEYMSYYYRNGPSSSFAFEDGFQLLPWGRGNLWYEGISETDIWECMAALEQLVSIDQKRKYLSGHSMGGYGAWMIGSKSAGVWAALGMHASAIWYGTQNVVTSEFAEQLKNVPTYFVCGTNDGLLSVNQQAYSLLQDAGNQNLEFVTFDGGHDYLQENVENMYLWMHEFVNDDYTKVKRTNSNEENKVSLYPNPVVESAWFSVNIKLAGKLKVSIYNSEGKCIAIPANSYYSKGLHKIKYTPEHMDPGVYIYEIQFGRSSTERGKMLIVK